MQDVNQYDLEDKVRRTQCSSGEAIGNEEGARWLPRSAASTYTLNKIYESKACNYTIVTKQNWTTAPNQIRKGD